MMLTYVDKLQVKTLPTMNNLPPTSETLKLHVKRPNQHTLYIKVQNYSQLII